jgi:hypothetical protein
MTISGEGVAYHWQVTVFPVFAVAAFLTVSPIATFCEVKKPLEKMAIPLQSTKLR